MTNVDYERARLINRLNVIRERGKDSQGVCRKIERQIRNLSK